ncbi:MAG: hypothetical protein WBW69_23115 [Candidatus Korobacteraceae bacterium]
MNTLQLVFVRMFRKPAGILVVVVALAGCSFAAIGDTKLTQDTINDFNTCLTEMRAGITQKQSSTQDFVRAIDPARLNSGKTVIGPGADCSKQVQHGRVTHWIGDVFIPGANVQDALKVLKDVARYPIVYGPEVVTCPAPRVLSENEETRRVSLRLEDKVGPFHKIDVVLDGVYEVENGQLDASHIYYTSRSVSIQEVRGSQDLPEGEGRGYLWRQNTYWRLEQRTNPAGVLAECEIISLSSDPNDLPWPISSAADHYSKDLPQTKLEFTLTNTAKAAKP